MVFAIALVYCIVCAAVCANMAASRHRPQGLWAFLGFMFGLFAILVLAAIGDDRPSRATPYYAEAPAPVSLATFAPPKRIEAPVQARPADDWLGSAEQRRWEVLKEVDPDIAAAALQVAAMDKTYEKELAQKYLTLNDKAYLPALLSNLQQRQAAAKTADDKVRESMSEASAEFYRDYMRQVKSNGGRDPMLNQPVVKVTGYSGAATPFQGGIKIVVADGQARLCAKGASRLFYSEAAADEWGGVAS